MKYGNERKVIIYRAESSEPEKNNSPHVCVEVGALLSVPKTSLKYILKVGYHHYCLQMSDAPKKAQFVQRMCMIISDWQPIGYK